MKQLINLDNIQSISLMDYDEFELDRSIKDEVYEHYRIFTRDENNDDEYNDKFWVLSYGINDKSKVKEISDQVGFCTRCGVLGHTDKYCKEEKLKLTYNEVMNTINFYFYEHSDNPNYLINIDLIEAAPTLNNYKEHIDAKDLKLKISASPNIITMEELNKVINIENVA